MPRQIRAATSAAVLSAGLLLGAGCASKPQPVADLASARTLIEEAEQSGAAQYASSDLETARSKLRQADQDAKDKPQVAQQLAQESSLDAQVALARTRAAKEQASLQQVNSGTSTLRGETERETPGGTAGPQ